MKHIPTTFRGVPLLIDRADLKAAVNADSSLAYNLIDLAYDQAGQAVDTLDEDAAADFIDDLVCHLAALARNNNIFRNA